MVARLLSYFLRSSVGIILFATYVFAAIDLLIAVLIPPALAVILPPAKPPKK